MMYLICRALLLLSATWVVAVVLYATFLNVWYSRAITNKLCLQSHWPKHVDEFFWRAGDAHEMLWHARKKAGV